MIDTLAYDLDSFIAQTKLNLPVLEWILILLWGSFILNVLLGGRLLYLGLIPRRLIGLPGIFFAPFLHLNFNHLFFNTIPLLVLSDFVLLQGVEYFLAVTFGIILISGVLMWCFAKTGIHVGASGLVTGYWGLLVMNIYVQGTLMAFMLGGVCLYYFAGIFFGIFPSERGVSWEGHFFGLLAGGLLGYFPDLLHYFYAGW